MKRWTRFFTTALVEGTVEISLTSLSNSNTNSYWDVFNEIIMASFIPTCFSSTMWVKVFSWVSNLNLSRSLLKNEDICWSSWLNLHHATLLKAVLPFSNEFQFGLFSEIYYEYSWQLFQLLDKKMEVFLNFKCKFYRGFFFLKMTRKVYFSK